MSNRRLIELQTGLLRHLTSEAFIFGTAGLETAVLDPDLRGMDIGQLRLEAEFSFSKRMSRIAETFSRTARAFGDGFPAALRDFAVACPPRTYERYPDARDFHDWFARCRADSPSVPPWTGDVARVEIALAQVRTFRPADMEARALSSCPADPPAFRYRAHPCVVLVRCGYDVSPLFVAEKAGQRVERRDLRLAVAISVRRRRPEIMELSPQVFETLERAADWSELPSGSDRERGVRTAEFLREACAQGLTLTRQPDGGDG